MRYVVTIRGLLPLCSDEHLIEKLLVLLVRLRDNNPAVLISIHKWNQDNTIGQKAGEILMRMHVSKDYDPNQVALEGILQSASYKEARTRCTVFLEQNLTLDPGNAIRSLSALLATHLNHFVRDAILDTIFGIGDIDDREETVIGTVEALIHIKCAEDTETICRDLLEVHQLSGNLPFAFMSLAALVIMNNSLSETVAETIIDVLTSYRPQIIGMGLPREQESAILAVFASAVDVYLHQWQRRYLGDLES